MISYRLAMTCSGLCQLPTWAAVEGGLVGLPPTLNPKDRLPSACNRDVRYRSLLDGFPGDLGEGPRCGWYGSHPCWFRGRKKAGVVFNGLSTVVGNSIKLRLGLVTEKLQPDAANSQAQCRT